MKAIVIFIPILLLICIAHGQVSEYFLPADDFMNKTFTFETNEWTNDNGKFKKEMSVNYFKDKSGNYNKHIELRSFRYNVLQFKTQTDQLYNIDENGVILIDHYTEGISEELERLGISGGSHINEVVLKNSGEKWTDKRDPDVIYYYSCETGSVSTKYAHYDDCLVVSESSKAINRKFIFIEKISYKLYYARGLGLVKTENFEDGKLMAMSLGYDGELIDNFSKYSIKQQLVLKQQAISLEKQRKELTFFLEQRKDSIYNYKMLMLNNYNRQGERIIESVIEILKENQLINQSFNIIARYEIDTLSIVSSNIIISGLENNSIEIEIKTELKKINFSPAYLKEYLVNAQAKYIYNFNLSSINLELKKNENEISIVNSEYLKENDLKYILNEFETKPLGKYVINYISYMINNTRKSEIEYLKYTGSGGPVFALLSLVIPGTGDYFVNNGKGSMIGHKAPPLVTTFTSLSFIGLGYYLKSESNKNYDLYHQSTQQDEIDKYYSQANNQNKSSYALYAIGGIIWAADILWVLSKGAQNKKTEKKTRIELKISAIEINGGNYYGGVVIKF